MYLVIMNLCSTTTNFSVNLRTKCCLETSVLLREEVFFINQKSM